jgi:1-acyl-sn-glycerol-3-phosphate acyltransferase
MSKPLRWWIARGLLAITGWKPDGVRPTAPHCVLIAAPHTTNWDFPYLLIFAAYFDLKIRWMGKHSLFRPPLGWFMRLAGGIPVVRHKRENIVLAMARSFKDHDELVLVVPAEGTRSRAEHWKSGFYHIARSADVPIVMSYLDYTKKRGGFGPALDLTGDVRRDMDQIRAFYAGKEGKHPEDFGPIRLLEEGEVEEGEVEEGEVEKGQAEEQRDS